MLAIFVATILSAAAVEAAAPESDGVSSADATEMVLSASLPEGGKAPLSDDPESARRDITIPKLTPISIQILKPLGSKLSKTGETFPIRLAAPILVNGVEAVPAGTEGMGEVIHAKKSGGMGAAGELVVTARYLDVDGRQLPLRSLHWAQSGQSRVDTVNTLNVASAASPLPIGLVGFFIGGGQINVAEGALADAKTAADFSIALPQVSSQQAGTGQELSEGDLAVPSGAVPDEAVDTESAAADVHQGGKE
ncbi:MAG: hypothetical protein BGO57_12860 [Sphingomonadales bacterium 63-6]|nr:MAG: hypothetical protein BGO57_12860 [Sphingomonadales bacterium 63-6]